jgi:hypothetical protein
MQSTLICFLKVDLMIKVQSSEFRVQSLRLRTVYKLRTMNYDLQPSTFP